MTIEEMQPWILVGGFLAFVIWRWWRAKVVRAELPALKQAGGVVVDVRSPAEYAMGSSSGSINIPLGDLEKRIKELDPSRPVILCCASGARSGMAVAILKAHGFKNVVNAGPWTNTNISEMG